MKKFRLSLIIFLSLIAAQSFAQSYYGNSKVIIPLTFVQGQPVIGLNIPDRSPLRFVFDTGKMGEEITTDETTLSGLNLKVIDSLQMGDPSGNNGMVFPVVNIPVVNIAGIKMYNVRAVVNPRSLPGINGVIGLAFFKDYLVTLDLSHQQLIIEKGEISAADSKDVLNYKSIIGIPEVNVVIGTNMLHAQMDCGNSRAAIVVPDSIAHLLTFISNPVFTGKARSLFNEVDMKEGKIKDTLSLGRYNFIQPLISYPSFGNSVNLGSAFLKQFIITFDQKNQKLRLKKVND